MGQTLSHGVYLPAEGERNCYSGLASNWNLLDNAIGDIAGKASATHTHGNITNDGKLATANRVLITDGNKVISLSGVTDTELSYLSGVTSAIQTQLNAKAADSDVVHKSGNETIAGDKTFSDGIYSSNYYYGTTAWGLNKANVWSAANYFNKTIFCDYANVALSTIPSEYIQDPLIIVEGDTWPKTWHGGIALERYTNGDEGFQFLTCSYVNGTNQQLAALRYLVSGDGISVSLFSRGPANNHLGTSTNTWKTLNGVNPGALSLPDYAHPTVLDVSAQGLNWYKDTTPNYYEIPANGFFAVIVQCPTVSNGVLDIFVNNTGIGSSDHGTYTGNELFCYVPVCQGQTVRVRARCDNYYSVTFYPCLGNV